MTADMRVGALRRAYATGALSPVEVTADALGRLSAHDGAGVWISTVDPDAALAAARALEARRGDMDTLPLYGAVFSVKDNIDVAGEETTAACPAFAYRADRSATVVERAIAAGAIYLGKTNLDQFATGLVGLRSPFGAPVNPAAPAYIPGGSSSGAAVSVATGVVSFAFGTDTGGSGRVPASYNGVVGLKPAPGEWSRAGLVYACRSFDTPSVFAADIAGCLAVDAAVRGPDPRDPFSVAVVRDDAPAHRVAASAPHTLDHFGDEVVPALYGAAHGRLSAFAPAFADVDLAPFQALNDLMFFGPWLAERDVSVGAFVDAHPADCHPVVRDLITSSRRFTAADAARAQYRLAEARAATAPLWERHDAVVAPTVGALLTVAMVEADPLGPNFTNGAYTNFANPLGLASVSTPAGVGPDGVPWGVTAYAPAGRLGAAASAASIAAANTAATG
jgi:allophanate hydrolase/aspartyl-tRNA(Asn)/glutamyl-tRNA(Gln) amidotransferase subunit A